MPKITDLSAAGSLDGTEEAPLHQSPSTVKATLATIRAWLLTMTGDLSMASHKITNLTDPASAQDAATKAYVDAASSGAAVLTTKGDLLTYAGGLTRLGVGSDGQVLTADSAQTDGIKWGAVASGSLVLLEPHSASTSASLVFTTSISASYDEYLIEFINVIPVTNAVNLYMRMSTNGGSTYDSGTNYSYNVTGLNRFGAGQTGVDSGGTQIQLNKSTIDNTATAGVSGSMRLFSPGSTSLHKNVQGQLNTLTGGVIESQIATGWYRSTTAVNAFQFIFSSGNIASGTVRVYGVAK